MNPRTACCPASRECGELFASTRSEPIGDSIPKRSGTDLEPVNGPRGTRDGLARTNGRPWGTDCHGTVTVRRTNPSRPGAHQASMLVPALRPQVPSTPLATQVPAQDRD